MKEYQAAIFAAIAVMIVGVAGVSVTAGNGQYRGARRASTCADAFAIMAVHEEMP